jgi:hypothetical protein
MKIKKSESLKTKQNFINFKLLNFFSKDLYFITLNNKETQKKKLYHLLLVITPNVTEINV